MPESSAIAGASVAAAAARALARAFAANVSPVSGGSSTPSGSGASSCSGSSAASSRSLCSLRVATTSLMDRSDLAHGGPDSLELGGPQPLDAGGRELEQLVERRARERGALGGGLHLDEPAVAGHDHVRVDLGRGVLGVVEVQ